MIMCSVPKVITIILCIMSRKSIYTFGQRKAVCRRRTTEDGQHVFLPFSFYNSGIFTFIDIKKSWSQTPLPASLTNSANADKIINPQIQMKIFLTWLEWVSEERSTDRCKIITRNPWIQLIEKTWQMYTTCHLSHLQLMSNVHSNRWRSCCLKDFFDIF